MEYTLSRYEKGRDENGNINSIFLAVTVGDGIYESYIERFLTSAEVALVLTNDNNLTPILEDMFALTELNLEKENANRPQPPEIVVDAQKQTIKGRVRQTEVAKRKLAWKTASTN